MKTVKDLRYCFYFVLLAIILLPSLVASGQTPQTITATGTAMGATGKGAALTLIFPPAGGPVSGTIYLVESGGCIGTLNLTMEGTFAGGDGGVASGTMNGTEDLNCGNGPFTVTYEAAWTGIFYANGTGSGSMDVHNYSNTQSKYFTAPWQVTFSSVEFLAALVTPTPTITSTAVPTETLEPTAEATPSPEPTRGLLSCGPQVSGLNPAKPGDVISPSAIYYDVTAKQVGIIQERWYLNGENTSSIVWDGNPVQVELQWTCLDHTGFSQTYTIPTYQEQPVAPAADVPAKPSGMTPGAMAIVIGSIIAGVGGGAWLTIAKLAHAAPKASVPPPPPAQPPALPPVRATPPDLDIPAAQPPKVSLPEAERARLTGIRSEMQAEAAHLKDQWKQTRDAVEKLTTLKKKNMIKFLIREGFETKEWIMDSPVEVINKFTLDPLVEKAFGKHDTSQDANIIVQINNRIQSLKAEMQQMVQQEKYLQSEISKITQSLKGK